LGIISEISEIENPSLNTEYESELEDFES